MADETQETEGSMIERMMKGEFDGMEISEELPVGDPADSAVNDEEQNNEGEQANNSGSELADEGTEGTDEVANGAEVSADETGDEDTEDTGSTDESDSDDTETTEQNDGDATDTDGTTGDDSEDTDSVNAPVGSDSDEKVETKDQGDGADAETAEPNYKEEYAKLLEESKMHKDYYDTVTSEFTANGVKVKGFKDPQKVIEAQQALYGLNEKFTALKKYRQFHAPLEKRGMVKDKAKFDLMMNIMDGDKEAMKTHMKALDIDPIGLDVDEINYQGQSTTSSEVELNLNDVLDASQNAGVREQVESVLYKDWDEESVVDLLSTEGSRNMFISHMQADENGNSIFNAVSTRAKQMAMTPGNNGFADMSSIQQYNVAMKEMEREYANQAPQRGSEQSESVTDAIAQAEQAEAKRTTEASAAAVEKYKLELENKNKVADEARKKASSVSTKKTVKKRSSKKQTDPMKLEGDNFMDYWKQLERVGR